MPNIASCIVNNLLGYTAGIHWNDIVTKGQSWKYKKKRITPRTSHITFLHV